MKELLGHYKLLIFPETKSEDDQPIFSFLTADLKVNKKIRSLNASGLGGQVSKGSSRKFYKELLEGQVKKTLHNHPQIGRSKSILKNSGPSGQLRNRLMLFEDHLESDSEDNDPSRSLVSESPSDLFPEFVGADAEAKRI